MTSGPSPAGVDELRFAASQLKGYTPRQVKRRRPRWLTPRLFVLILIADLVVGSVAWHYLTKPSPGPVAAAVEGIANDAARGDWNAVYNRLCSSDRAQTAEPDLAQAGGAAMLSIGELDHVTVTNVQPVTLPVTGPIHWPAAEVSGQLVPVIGQPSAYTATVVRELDGWQMCLSVGGYSSAALGVNVPLGG